MPVCLLHNQKITIYNPLDQNPAKQSHNAGVVLNVNAIQHVSSEVSSNKKNVPLFVCSSTQQLMSVFNDRNMLKWVINM